MISMSLTSLCNHPHCWIPEHFHHSAEEAPYPWALTPWPSSTHSLWQAPSTFCLWICVFRMFCTVLSRTADLREAFSTLAPSSAWCLQGPACCSVCELFFFNGQILFHCVHLPCFVCSSSIDGHFLPPEPLGHRSHLSGVCVGREASWLASACFCSLTL